MEFTFNFSISAEDVFNQITSPEFIIDRCIDLGSLDASCESNEEHLPSLTISRIEQADLPSMMKKILGDQQTIKTRQEWSETDQSYDNVSTTSIEGAPITVKASQSLYNLEEGSEISVDLTVKANIPLVGKKVEAMVATKIRDELIREFEYIEQRV